MVTGALLGLMFLVPYHSYAATSWQPRTNAELIAFLYGVVVQLQIQLDALRADPDYQDDDDGYYNDNDDDDDDGSSSSGRPHVVTGSAEDLTANSAMVSADVDMRSYGYGNVFVVFGTSESKVSAVTRENSFDDIEMDDKIKRFSISTGYSGPGELSTGLYSLLASTKYYYRACVEYIDDGDDDDTEITCGTVKSFTTKRR